MRLKIEHQTYCVYAQTVKHSIQQLRLTPRTDMGLRLLHWQIKVEGELQAFEDAFGNLSHTLVVDYPHQSFHIHVLGEVETGVAHTKTAPSLPLPVYLRETPLTQADVGLCQFAFKFANQTADHLMHGLQDHMQTLTGTTNVATTAAQAFQLRQGVCQDFNHVFIACCHALAWPVRYVSGYLFTMDGKAMQAHAWVEVWQDDTWKGLDIVNGVPVNEAYVKLAMGLDYSSASPVIGLWQGGDAASIASLVQRHLITSESPLATDWAWSDAHLMQQAHIAQQ